MVVSNHKMKTIDLLSLRNPFLGQITALLVTLMQKLNEINDLQINNIMLERYEANKLLDIISIHLNQKIKKLSLINLTTNHCRLHQLDMFTKLQVCIDI